MYTQTHTQTAAAAAAARCGVVAASRGSSKLGDRLAARRKSARRRRGEKGGWASADGRRGRPEAIFVADFGCFSGECVTDKKCVLCVCVCLCLCLCQCQCRHRWLGGWSAKAPMCSRAACKRGRESRCCRCFKRAQVFRRCFRAASKRAVSVIR